MSEDQAKYFKRLNLGMRYTGHDRGVVVTQPQPSVFHERPMTQAELAARTAAATIQDDIYRHANYAGACYHALWEIIAKAAQEAVDAELERLRAECEELRRDNARYANAHAILMAERARMEARIAQQAETIRELPPASDRSPFARSTVTLEYGGQPFAVDAEITSIVKALNDGGFSTVASCSGHGYRPGRVSLTDGRELFILPSYEVGQWFDTQFPRDINGQTACERSADALDATVGVSAPAAPLGWEALKGCCQDLWKSDVTLVCTLPLGHEGDHRMAGTSCTWTGGESNKDRVAKLLRPTEPPSNTPKFRVGDLVEWKGSPAHPLTVRGYEYICEYTPGGAIHTFGEHLLRASVTKEPLRCTAPGCDEPVMNACFRKDCPQAPRSDETVAVHINCPGEAR